MTKERRRQTILAVVMFAAVAAGGGAIYQMRQTRAKSAHWASLLPPLPDLQRWPAEMQRRLSQAHAHALAHDGSVGDLSELAELYLANHYNAEAEKVLSILLERDPKNAHWTYFLGVLHRNENDVGAAERFFQSTLALDADYAPAWLQRGQLLGQAKKLAEARTCFDTRLRLIPNDPQSEYELAKIDFAEGKAESAVGRLSRVVVSDPSLQEAHLMLADLLEQRGDQRGAATQRAFVRGGRPSPPTRDPWLEEIYLKSFDTYLVQAYGAMLMEGGKTEASIVFLRRAQELEPSDVEVIGSLAKAYDDLGKHDQAENVLRAALSKTPQSEMLNVRLAQSAVRAGKPETGLLTVDSALKSLPESPLLLSAKGEILLALRRPSEARDALEKALQQDSTQVAAQLNLGRARLALGDRSGALAAGLRAVQMRPDDKGALGFLASLQLEMRDFEAAENNAEKLYQLDPQEHEAVALISRVKLQRGNFASEANRFDQAEKAYREGLEADPNNAQLHGALGMLLGKERRYSEATVELEEFLRRAPADPFAYLLLASAQANAGSLSMARETVARGLKVSRETKNAARTQQLESLARQLAD